MAKYKLTNEAVEDLTVIWNYTFDRWSWYQADKNYLTLLENCYKVTSRPESGKNYATITENLFGFKAGPNIIFYRKTEENEVMITRILHEQMDLKNKTSE